MQKNHISDTRVVLHFLRSGMIYSTPYDEAQLESVSGKKEV